MKKNADQSEMSALPAAWCCISYIRKFKKIPFILMIFPPEFNFVSVQFGLRGKEPRLVPLVKFYCLRGKLSVRFGTGQASITQQPQNLPHHKELCTGRGENQMVREQCCRQGTQQEHQSIRTNATVSKDSDFSVLMVVYDYFFKKIFKRISDIKK